MEYKDSVNLPQTDFPMRAGSATREPEIQAHWRDLGLYARMLERRQDAPLFILHDGPPYSSSGAIHIGHALNKTLKDLVVKYRMLSGHRAPFVPGYDTHGLPTEVAALKELKARHQDMSPLEVRRVSREFAVRSIEMQKQHFMRLGGVGDWDRPYVTLDPAFEAQQIRIFGEMAARGHIYKGKKPVYWCPLDQTALAEAEIEYAEAKDPAITVRFPLVASTVPAVQEALSAGNHAVSLVIWTTTPWTLPANLAIAVGADIDYTLVEVAGHGLLLVALDRLPALAQDLGTKLDPTGAPFKGSDLVGSTYRHVWADRTSPVIVAEHVTTDAGSGLVHTAPGHGMEDYLAGLAAGLDILAPLDDRGRFTDEVADWLEGKAYRDANPVIIERLRADGVLVHEAQILHSVAHCWRDKQPVILRATEQWFASIDGFREQALEAIRNVRWLPASGETRISNMVAGRTDWCISRQRTWGVPIPVFYCEHDQEPLLTAASIDAVASLFEREGADAWWRLEAHEILPEGTRCAHCGGTHFRKEADIMDVWFDSGSTWSTVCEQRPELRFPADLYLEGSDQYRGWYQSSLLTAVATRGVAPYRTVLTHGFVLDGQGRKMSKSMGNVIEPLKVIDQYGADVLRLYVASVDYTSDVRISEVILKQLAEVYRKVRNTARFLLGNLHDFDPALHTVDPSGMDEIDRLALNRLGEIVAEVTDSFETYTFSRFYQIIQNYCTVDLSSFYLDIVKDRLYAEGVDSPRRRATQTVLHRILDTLVVLISPVLSHLAEDIHLHLPPAIRGSAPSVFLRDWPSLEAFPRDAGLAERWGRIQEIRDEVMRALEQARQSKAIGRGAEADVVVEVTDVHRLGLLQDLGDLLKDVLLVASARVELVSGEPVTARVSPTKAPKCERCWNHDAHVGTRDRHPTLCPRCTDVMEQLAPTC